MVRTGIVPRPSWCLSVTALLVFAGVLRADEPSQLREERVFPKANFEVAVEGFTAQQYQERMAGLYNWLMTELPAGAFDNPIQVDLTREEIAEIDAEEPSGTGPMRIGVVKELDNPVAVNLRDPAAERRSGLRGGTRSGAKADAAKGFDSVEATDDGGFVWARAVSSPGAVALRVQLTNLSLPADADLYWLSMEGEAYGPFQGRGAQDDGELWLPSIMSDTGLIVVRHFGPNGAADLDNLSMTISAVGHIGRGFPGAHRNGDGGVAAFCTFNASCVENASCHNTGPAAAAEGAAAKMLWIAGCCINICTGGLIADTDASTTKHYFLTANHCISRNNHASNLEAFFQYQVNCGGNCPVGSFQAPPSPKTVGAVVRATNRTGDYTLLELSQAPPSGSVYLGWNSTPIANTNGASLYRIHHPAGAPQAYSRHSVDTGAGTCSGWPRGERIYSNDTLGATEGGSSGSPVVNSAGQVVGQLSGCCGFNCGNVCDSGANSTVDGALASYFSQVAPFLDPSPCTPTTASCSDGVDNDCDGLTDCNDTNGGAEDCSSDPGCGGGGCVNPGGAPPGTSCTSNGDCCSNNCKGRPSNKTCR